MTSPIMTIEADLDALSQELDDLLAYGPDHDLGESRRIAAKLAAEHLETIFWEITVLRATEAFL